MLLFLCLSSFLNRNKARYVKSAKTQFIVDGDHILESALKGVFRRKEETNTVVKKATRL